MTKAKHTVTWANAQTTRIQGAHYAKQRKAALTAKRRAKHAKRERNGLHRQAMTELRLERLWSAAGLN